MTDLSKEELLKLAELSALTLNENEIEILREQLAKTIAYTEELDQFSTTIEHEAIKNINVFREDKAKPKDSALLLAQAPQTAETYFVVPKILDQE